MLRITIALLTLICSAQLAADPAQTERLLKLTHMDRSVELMAQQISQLVQAQVAQMSTSEEQGEQVTQYLTRIHGLIEQELTWDKVRRQFISAYDRSFTDEEIDQLVEFFDSPVGLKYVEQIPTLQRDALEIAQQHAQLTLVPAIQQLVGQMQAELAAADHADPASK